MRIEHDHKRWDRIGGILCLVLLMLQLAVFLLSWIISTTNPDIHVRSLLGGEGIRWFFGHFMAIIGGYGAAWLIVILIACGAVAESGIWPTIRSWTKKDPLSYRQKYALRCSVVALLFFIAVLVVLTCTKEAVLVSAAGNLFPSSFSKAIVPILSFILTAIALLFGSLSAQFHHIGDAFHALYVGPQRGAPIFVIYIFVCQLIASLAWAFMT
ncbi:MAG: AbgT family transporter [Prevotella sp.]|nr:AbgT family transporter [Prevotella sp.]